MSLRPATNSATTSHREGSKKRLSLWTQRWEEKEASTTSPRAGARRTSPHLARRSVLSPTKLLEQGERDDLQVGGLSRRQKSTVIASSVHRGVGYTLGGQSGAPLVGGRPDGPQSTRKPRDRRLTYYCLPCRPPRYVLCSLRSESLCQGTSRRAFYRIYCYL